MLTLGKFAGQSEKFILNHLATKYAKGDISYECNPEEVEKLREELKRYRIIVAFESPPDDYFEESFFLLQDKGTNILYENHAYHCSCMGWESQFNPEETTTTELLFRLKNKEEIERSINKYETQYKDVGKLIGFGGVDTSEVETYQKQLLEFIEKLHLKLIN
jgi:NADPH:quinone reductase-like Zn-dependent oxidoreductase